MKHLLPALRLMLVMTLLLGLIYPAIVTGLGKVLFAKQAQGNLELIGQKFTQDRYFWGRPSATDYNPLPSGGSNLSLTSQALQEALAQRTQQMKNTHPENLADVPSDLVMASASGLDPHISPAATAYQLARVARARGLSSEVVQKLVQEASAPRTWGLFGEPTVNVLRLNLSLDRQQARD